VAATVALLTAAALVAAGVFRGYPIATAFTVTGAVVGVGLALGGSPAWAKYQEIVTLWVLVPFIGGGTAYGTARLLRNESVPEVAAVPALAGLVGVILANVEFVFLGPAGEAASLTAAATTATGESRLLVTVVGSLLAALFVGGLVAQMMRRDEAQGQQRFLLALGGLVAFSAGGSQVGLAIGPLLPLLDPSPFAFAIPLVAMLVFGGLGLLVGSWTGAPRMIKALAQDYSSLGPRRSIAALIPSFAIAQTAVFFGIPVSFNEIIVSAIIGSGYAAGDGDVSRTKMAYTVLAWIGSLALALGVGYAGYTGVTALLG
jgi:PiT family inorganic phosphate transporter